MFKKVTDKPYYTSNHSCFLLSAHLVLVTKYRKPVLQGAVKEYVYSLIRETMENENIIIREMNGEPDHIHILFDYAPDIKLTGQHYKDCKPFETTYNMADMEDASQETFLLLLEGTYFLVRWIFCSVHRESITAYN